jgi:hypothetical protein
MRDLSPTSATVAQASLMATHRIVIVAGAIVAALAFIFLAPGGDG